MRAPRLKAVRGQGYCGPTALAALTGRSIESIEQLVKRRRRLRGVDTWRRRVVSMSYGEALGVLGMLGYQARPLAVFEHDERRPTLVEWFDSRPAEAERSLMLVSVTGHYVAAAGSVVVCSMQRGEQRHYYGARCARCRMRRVWLVTPPARRRRAS